MTSYPARYGIASITSTCLVGSLGWEVALRRSEPLGHCWVAWEKPRLLLSSSGTGLLLRETVSREAEVNLPPLEQVEGVGAAGEVDLKKPRDQGSFWGPADSRKEVRQKYSAQSRAGLWGLGRGVTGGGEKDFQRENERNGLFLCGEVEKTPLNL